MLKDPQEYTILIVDDDTDLSSSIAFDLNRKGFQTLCATGGNEAMQLIASGKKVDLVITDTNMPNGSGVDLIKQSKAKNPALPIFIFISGGSSTELTGEEAYDMGADAVFAKPFDRKELLSAIKYFLLPIEQRFKRRTTRIDIDSIAGVKFLKNGLTARVRTLNIGRGGAFIAIEENFPSIGDELEFHIQSSSDPSVEFRGTGIVRWARTIASEDEPTGCGIEFLGLDEDSQKQIIELAKNSNPKSFIPKK